MKITNLKQAIKIGQDIDRLKDKIKTLIASKHCGNSVFIDTHQCQKVIELFEEEIKELEHKAEKL